LERRRERGNRAGAILEKEGNMGGLGKHALLPPRSRQGRGGGRTPRSGGGLQVPTAAGGRGKRRRRARASHPRAHLGLGRREEPDRRAAADWWCWLAVVARCGRAARQWRGCGGLVVRRGRGRAIYSRSEVGSGEIFVHTGAPARSTPASSSSFARRRPVAGQLVPVRGRGAVDRTRRAGGELASGRWR
jgi:hypothetical protein